MSRVDGPTRQLSGSRISPRVRSSRASAASSEHEARARRHAARAWRTRSRPARAAAPTARRCRARPASPSRTARTSHSPSSLRTAAMLRAGEAVAAASPRRAPRPRSSTRRRVPRSRRPSGPAGRSSSVVPRSPAPAQCALQREARRLRRAVDGDAARPRRLPRRDVAGLGRLVAAQQRQIEELDERLARRAPASPGRGAALARRRQP